MKAAIRHAVLPALLALWATDAAAAPFQMTFTSTVSSVTPSLDTLVSVGDLFTVHVVVDNGGTSALSQTWTFADHVSATLQAGVYFATITSGFYFPPTTQDSAGINAASFATDAAGNLTKAAFFGASAGMGTDNFGGPFIGFFNGHVNTSAHDPAGDVFSSFNYSPNFGGFPNGRLAQWTGPVALPSVIPLPASLPLMLAGLAALGGLAVARRRAA